MFGRKQERLTNEQIVRIRRGVEQRLVVIDSDPFMEPETKVAARNTLLQEYYRVISIWLLDLRNG